MYGYVYGYVMVRCWWHVCVIRKLKLNYIMIEGRVPQYHFQKRSCSSSTSSSITIMINFIANMRLDFILFWCILLYRTDTNISSFCNANGFNMFPESGNYSFLISDYRQSWRKLYPALILSFMLLTEKSKAIFILRFVSLYHLHSKQISFCTYLSGSFGMFDPPVKSWQEN